MGWVATIYKEAGKQELYLKQRPEELEKRAPHSRYFSDELGALFIYNNIEHMFTCLVTYGIIFIWKKIYLLLKKILFRMVEDMCTRFNIIWSDARNTERKF